MKYQQLLSSIVNEYKDSGRSEEQLLRAAQKGLDQAIALSQENDRFKLEENLSWYARQAVLRSITKAAGN